MNVLKLKRQFIPATLAILLSSSVPAVIMAASTSTGTTINATLGSTITIATSGTVNLSLTPTVSGVMSSSSDSVNVATNHSTGYALTLSNGDGTTDLVNGGNVIAADSGTQSSPSGTLTNNRWGYRVDGVGGFGAGLTSAETNAANSTYSWAGVPPLGSPNTIRTTSGASGSSTTTVWYGVKADTTKPNGTYADTVTYTATTN